MGTIENQYSQQTDVVKGAFQPNFLTYNQIYISVSGCVPSSAGTEIPPTPPPRRMAVAVVLGLILHKDKI